MFFAESVEALLPGPIYLLLLLLVLAFGAWASPSGCALRRARFVFVLLAGWAWAACTPRLAELLVVALEGPLRDPGQEVVVRDSSTVVIVLSSGELRAANGERRVRLDVNGWERLQGGVRLWRRTGGTLLFTGGPAGTPEGSIAWAVAAIAQTDFGVPASAIRLSPQSSNTYEELHHVAQELRTHRGPVWLVTSAMHMPRALAVAARVGLRLQAHAVDYRQIPSPSWRGWIPSNMGFGRFRAALHEVVGLWMYRQRGWAI